MTQDKTTTNSQEETINSSDEQQLIRENLDENELANIAGGASLTERVMSAFGITASCAGIGAFAGRDIDNKHKSRNEAYGAIAGLALGGAASNAVDRKYLRGENEGIAAHAANNVVELAQHRPH